MAFNAKNLEYNKQEPAFLRKLRGEVGGVDGRHNIQIARPKKDRLKTGDDDDDPVIVDEQGERVDKEEFERRVKEGNTATELAGTEEAAAATETDVKGDGERERANERQKVTEIGVSGNLKKRKAGKVVGAEDEAEGEANDGADSTASDAKQIARSKPAQSETKPTKKKESGAAKKKGKKIKLSFDDPDG
ncbi:hypothetical protein A1O3_04775 [Capronia epimyces CBS 606.96]|uniref:DUF4604 domain-containing protein n=1 Tax=Capronia epimyces CBS 606.96 TaxID=1182542 RepID=W9XV44_9EURO|nr:uncharacterized protein A1O3_04775 [Capronia epimyces CBS 606.96]EXJ84108.1 hypothetical protein A1O3_04775 [Capronia epimyces CBS 606.96]